MLDRLEYTFSKISEMFSTIEDTSLYPGIIALLLMKFIISINAFSRYFLDYPLSGVYEGVSLYLLPAIIMFSGAYLQRQEGQVTINVISRKLTDDSNELIKIVARTLTLGLFCLIIYDVGSRSVELTMNMATTKGVVQFPTYVSWWIVTIGLTLLCIRLTIQIAEGVISFAN